jgi:tetratricopeptide (TPR) repeat protein
LPETQRAVLARVNGPGLAKLREYLAAGEAVAFLGAGASAPLYPLWTELIGQLVAATADRLTESQAATCQALAVASPEEVVEIVRRYLGPVGYREVLREVLRARTDPASGRSWTPVQELVCRCAFKGVVTTNYDPGIVNARMRVRPDASGTGFMTWQDELGLDRWRTGKVFGDAELPVLFAHGTHSQPDSVVLATTEYRRAYEGKLARVLERQVDGGHLVWIGFSFTDQRIAAILREVAHWSGTRAEPGAASEHVAIMAWDPAADGNNPEILAERAQISYGAQAVLYPASTGDHAALPVLLSTLTDARFPPAADLLVRPSAMVAARSPAPIVAAHPVPVTWVHGAEVIEHFTGREEELARLDRWAADPQVALVGVTAWGGAGKTALVTRWVQQGGASKRPGVRGGFGWSFYADPSAEHWADALLDWAGQEFGIRVAASRSANAVLSLLQVVPLLLMLDGLEVVQEGPAVDGFGRLLDGTLREVLTGACRLHPLGLVMLTSRFPFADLESFDGSSARMLDVPAFTPADGSALLAAAGGNWLDDSERRELVAAVDGHALAVGVLAGALADRPAASDLAALRAELTAVARTSVRVGRVLRFYAERLSDPDRYLVAAVSLFARPVLVEAVLTVARHEAFGSHLAGWTHARVVESARDRLGGLISVHPDGSLSAHPLVRASFRPLVLSAAQAAAVTVLAGVPEGQVRNRADALRVVEVIELLLDADQWQAADDLYRGRTDNGMVWMYLPAARLGQRTAGAFVAAPARRDACAVQLTPRLQNHHVASLGLYSMFAGDLVTAREYLSASVLYYRDVGDAINLSIGLRNLADCLGHLGEIDQARRAAAEALAGAKRLGARVQIRNSHAYLGWLAGVNGDPVRADEHFAAADQIEVADDSEGRHMCSLRGSQWAEWLAHTGRTSPALALVLRNREICEWNDWTDDAARCDRMLGRLALIAGDIEATGERLAAAARCFRDGDLLIELAITLADLAEYARLIGDLDAADQHATEAITIAAPRGLLPAYSSGLAARARISADRAAPASDADHLAEGRDAAEAALRLAIRHHLAWCELGALRAHAVLDQAEGVDRGWADRANTLRARLVPPGLDPDPLATVERLVAADKAAKEAAEQSATHPEAGAGPEEV